MASQSPQAKAKNKFAPKRKAEDAEMDITPMIDVTFLLLIFFIVASKMDPQAAIDMPGARYGAAVPAADCVTIVLEKEGDGANIFLGRTKDPANMLESGLSNLEKENRLTEFMRRGLEEGFDGSPPKSGVLIKGEQDVAYEFIYMVQQAAGRVAQDLGQDVTLHTGVHEEVSDE